MGLPKILIEFKTLADTLITRSEHGVVAVILTDSTNQTKSYSYSSEKDVVKSHFTTANQNYLSLAFKGNPSKVLVERIGSNDDLTDALERLSHKQWSYVAMPDCETADITEIKTFITTQRGTYNKSYKAVLPSTAANYEGVINFATDDIKVGSKTYSTAEYTVRIAGILAGLAINRSATYYVLDEVDSITESETPDTDVDNGKLILINDGTKIKIARGVNSLTTITDSKGDDFKKIKIIEAVDMIRDDIRTTFEDDFVGKVENSYDNKVIFVAAVNKYFSDLASQGVLYDKFSNLAEIDFEATRDWLMEHNRDISTWDEEKIKTANTGTDVLIKANIQVQDAIEDLKFQIYIN